MKRISLLGVLIVSTCLSAQQSSFSAMGSFQSNSSNFQNISSSVATKHSLGDFFSEEKKTPFGEKDKSDFPYEWKWLRDGVWTGVGLGASVYGLSLIRKKHDLSDNEFFGFTDPTLLQEKIDNINFMDRWVAGSHSQIANDLVNVPFVLSLATPFVFLFDDEIRDNVGPYLGLYLESLATTTGIYTVLAGFIDRSRPYVYDNSGDTSTEIRRSKHGQRSFYSGHVASAATATFFAAKVYTDIHPDANGKLFIWTGAAILPALVGGLRMDAGQHFLTDVLLGYALGACSGILVPVLHNKKYSNIDVYPSTGTISNGVQYKGMAFRYTF